VPDQALEAFLLSGQAFTFHRDSETFLKGEIGNILSILLFAEPANQRPSGLPAALSGLVQKPA
jgi:hypothetical protein